MAWFRQSPALSISAVVGGLNGAVAVTWALACSTLRLSALRQVFAVVGSWAY